MSEAAHAALWEPPVISGPVLSRARRALDPEAAEREARERGYADGHAAGIEAAKREHQAAMAELGKRVQEMDGLLALLARPLAALDREVERQLAQLAGAIARQLVRRELKAHPDEIIAVIRETVALLPVTAREVRVHLHPEDAALVRQLLSETSGERAWAIAEDPIIARGGCRVTSQSSMIDAQLETRLGAAIAAVLGDARTPLREGARPGAPETP